MHRLTMKILALAIALLAIFPVAFVFAQVSDSLVVVGTSGTTVLQPGTPEAIGAATITLLAAIVGWILAVWPTANDKGTVPGRIANILQHIGTGLVYVVQVVTALVRVKKKPEEPAAPAPAAQPEAAPSTAPAQPPV